MKGELLNYYDLKKKDSNTKVWIEKSFGEKKKIEDVYIIKNQYYGVTFVKSSDPEEYEYKNYSSFRIDDRELKEMMDNKLIFIYEWLSQNDYLEIKENNLWSLINLFLNIDNKSEFIKLTTEYKELLKHKANK